MRGWAEPWGLGVDFSLNSFLQVEASKLGSGGRCCDLLWLVCKVGRAERRRRGFICSQMLKKGLISLVLSLYSVFHLIRVVNSDGIEVCKGNRILPTGKCLWLLFDRGKAADALGKRLFGSFS